MNRCERLTEIIPSNLRKAYDVTEIIKCMFDEQSFLEIQAGYAENVIIGFAYLENRSIVIIANQPLKLAGALDFKATNKIARFIRFCDCFNIPLITLVDVPAFLPGREQEKEGIIKCGAKMLYAYAEATVPKITLIMRKAFGGAYIAMNSKGLGADIVYAWPISEMAVMGPENAIEFLCTKNTNYDTYDDYLKDYYEKIMSPYVAAQNGYVDEIIKPFETRERILSGLNVLAKKAVGLSSKVALCQVS